MVKVAKKVKAHVKFLSTDKAFHPVSIYGYSKAWAEQIVLDAGYTVIRSGNIFKSSGSVVPLFIQQVKDNNVLTLTDGNMTRFFISVRDLVTYMGAVLWENTIFTPDMQAFRLRDIAEVVKHIHGNQFTEIKETGIRPGEKMHEILNGRNSLDCLGSMRDLYELFDVIGL